MKKFLAIVLSLVLCLGLAAGCGDDISQEDKEHSLIIEVFGGGYGTDWIDSLGDAYTKKTGQKVIVTVQTGQQGISNMTTNINSMVSDTDIFFTSNPSFSDVYKGKVSVGDTQYDCLFAEMTDLYNSTIEGENITVKDKMIDSFEEYFNMDGKYYFFPYSTSMLGFVINMGVWDASWDIPRTTDELIALARRIKNEKPDIAPFIYSLGDEYWTSISHTFFCQYEGIEQMNKFYQGFDPEGHRYSDNMVAYDGYYETLKFFEELLKDSNKFMHSASKDINFTNMQGLFLQGKAVFTPNGDWLEREMIYNYPDVNIKMIKTPVLSAVANKCSFASAADKDAKLAALIDYVDGKTEKPSWATDSDVATVTEARNIEYVSGHESIALIPCYSNQISAAKDFLKFMASDEGMKIFRAETKGCELPLNYTVAPSKDNSTGFRKSIDEIMNRSIKCFVNSKDKVYSIGGVNVYLYNNSKGRWVNCFTATSEKDYVDALTYYNAEVAAVKKMLPTAKQKMGWN